MESSPLFTFIELIGRIGIPYWLDSGSLLGVHREQRLIPWDHDIDIGMWVSDIHKVKEFAVEFESRGFVLDFQYYDGILYNVECKVHQGFFLREIPIHVHGYIEKDGYAYAPQIIVCDPKPSLQPRWAVEQPSTMRDFLLFCKREAIRVRNHEIDGVQRLLGLLLAYPVWGLLCLVRNPLDRTKWVSRWPFKLLYRVYTWRIPSHFFLSLGTVNVEDTSISVPRERDLYLTYRYGDWKVPNSNWIYWRDDKALLEEAPQTFEVW